MKEGFGSCGEGTQPGILCTQITLKKSSGKAFTRHRGVTTSPLTFSPSLIHHQILSGERATLHTDVHRPTHRRLHMCVLNTQHRDTYTCTRIHTHTVNILTDTLTHTHVHICKYKQIYAHVWHTEARTRTDMHADIQKKIHTHVCTHTNWCFYLICSNLLVPKAKAKH